ncbi:MAG: hypoxanthine-guanine phosphoribosyltransferase [Gammaproteobacteria bacterium HGW-Gammaproteobacteria-3]|nr:MAG: hypoxanthine-guanine phosphoribosyltransferase [Gammaproteobacteria bacterium HGW-Gammaproteobacteria-3]
MTILEHINRVKTSADLLHNKAEVDAVLDRMADEINRVLAERNPLFLCVMNGGMVIGGELLTRLTMPLTVDAINASRYRNQTSGDSIEWLLKPKTLLHERTILIVDDILDEGLTLAAIADYCRDQGAAAVYSAVLVEKILAQDKPVQADFVGLQVENRYLFGCGMDYKGYLRNMPGIYAVKDNLL